MDASNRRVDKGPGEILVVQPLTTFDCVLEMALNRITFCDSYVVAALHHSSAARLPKQPLHGDGDIQVWSCLVRV